MVVATDTGVCAVYTSAGCIADSRDAATMSTPTVSAPAENEMSVFRIGTSYREISAVRRQTDMQHATASHDGAVRCWACPEPVVETAGKMRYGTVHTGANVPTH